MEKQKLLILDKDRINWKLRRMAWQVWEHNTTATGLSLIGIAQGGVVLAQRLAAILQEISPLKVDVISLKMNKRDPLQEHAVLGHDLHGRSVVLVDDVANSGRTLLYALKPLLEHKLSRVMIAVLVDRQHKAFPISPDIVGHTVSTTLQEHIEVEHDGKEILAAYLC